ncbi:uncharacterized protein DUF5126 [Dyadobacter jejuensis]|uniref:Uncharacterized protein DUF5126 n=1 Tax=Dyadobacter jejuensis TaxID=1082580 RepID=A0A316AKP9_9BACT|nr:DUF5000 domain-containing lipoprotein [Dyadobacter jejuensis]PWJ57948.1 uncharacterized protein DUF5126 [Dyadobacter jejuensis]
MKSYAQIKCLFFSTLMALLFSCGDDNFHGPIEKDNTPPAPVTEVQVKNTAGGAELVYQLPSDPDLLRIEATFSRGTEIITKTSSVFKNVITLDGLKSGQEIDVTLTSVDRSNNHSTPVVVKVTPLRAPIDDLFDSFSLKEDFGGVRLSYDNKSEVQVEIQILKKNKESGLYQYQSSAFISNNQRTGYSFRGFEPEQADFAAVAIDRWNNISDTIFANITPIQEQLLDIQKFKKIAPAIPNDSKDAFGWIIENLWNNNINGSGFHTSQTDGGALIAPYTEPYPVFSFDLGVTANISRIKFWQRQGTWIFAHGNPRNFEIWGIDKIPANYDGTSMEGWTRLVEEGEVKKPSGAALGQNSADDVAQAASGEEFESVDPSKPIRYIRFVNKKNWSGANFIHIMEINLWGKVLE